MFAQVLVAADESLEFGAVFLRRERHGGQFLRCGDVHQLRAVQATHVFDQVGVAGLDVSAVDAHVVTFVEETEFGGRVLAFVDGVADGGNHAVRRNECGEAEFRSVAVVLVRCAGERRDLVARTVGDGGGVAEGVGSQKVKTELEGFLQLCGHREVLSVVTFNVVQIVTAHLAAIAVGDTFAGVVGACFGFAGQLNFTVFLVSEQCGIDFVEVIGIDSFHRGLDTAGHRVIQC